MAKIKIVSYRADETTPFVTVTIPSSVFKIAKKLIPKKAYRLLEEQNIDLEGIEEIMKSGEATGVLLEVEDHKKKEKIVISVEG